MERAFPVPCCFSILAISFFPEDLGVIATLERQRGEPGFHVTRDGTQIAAANVARDEPEWQKRMRSSRISPQGANVVTTLTVHDTRRIRANPNRRGWQAHRRHSPAHTRTSAMCPLSSTTSIREFPSGCEPGDSGSCRQ